MLAGASHEMQTSVRDPWSVLRMTAVAKIALVSSGERETWVPISWLAKRLVREATSPGAGAEP